MSKEKSAVGRLNEINQLVKNLKSEQDEVKATFRDTQARLEVINKKLKPLELEARMLRTRTHSGGIGLSDHAILKYLERKENLNVASIKEAVASLLTPNIKEASVEGFTDFIIGDLAYRYDCSTNTLVTVLRVTESYAPPTNVTMKYVGE